ncbi:MAG: transposase family protein [candidate division WOR-3 bacterium]
MLRPVRAELLAKRRYKSNPFASWLKKRIPVETCHDKPKKELGYLEIDLLSHGGQSPCGEFAYTLVVTEITTGWTELRVLRNKAHIWVMLAMKSILRAAPFPVTAIHSDNGSEFINQALAKPADKHKLRFTRSRAYQENDSPYVESKNWSLVRSYVGYRRHDTKEENLALRGWTG